MAAAEAGVFVFLAGSAFYPLSFFTLKALFHLLWKTRLTSGDIYELCVRSVSSLQAVISSMVGIVILRSCRDIMHDQNWLTNTYAKFLLPYFYYDTWAMYTAHWYRHPVVQTMTGAMRLRHFLKSNSLLMIHHLVMPVIVFPLILYFRKGQGDYFVGVFYLFEITVPFISARFILVQLKLKDRPLYIIVGLAMIATFFVSRVLVFPYLFWVYAEYRNISAAQVPSVIPVKCTLSCLGLLIWQSYWLYLMVRGAAKVFYKIYRRRKLG